MRKSQDSPTDSHSHSDTQSILSSQFDQLNYAMIHDDSNGPLMTPSNTRKFKKNVQLAGSSSDQSDWKTRYTRTIFHGSPPPKLTPQKINEIKRTYPVQSLNIKCKTVTVCKKNNSKQKYENLCSICLDEYTRTTGILKCGHKYCFQCINQWIKTSTNCPCCRDQFSQFVKVTMHPTLRIQEKRQIVKVEIKKMEYNQLDYFICYQCNRGDDQDVLLICDMCDFYCCHVYCDSELRNVFPTDDWYCRFCKTTIQKSIEDRPNTRASRTQSVIQIQRPHTQITRTVTLNTPTRRFIEEDFSSESEDQNSFAPGRRTRAAQRADKEIGRVTRSKAFEIVNLSHRDPRNRLPQVIERITNNTAMNLRNLRRRRNY